MFLKRMRRPACGRDCKSSLRRHPRTTGRTTENSRRVSGSTVFDQQHEHEVVNGGRLESPAPVETGCARIFGMDEYQTESGQVGYLDGSSSHSRTA